MKRIVRIIQEVVSPHIGRKNHNRVLAEYLYKDRVYVIPYLCILLHLIFLIYRYGYCLVLIEGKIISNNAFYIMIAAFGPFFLWFLSTLCERLNYGKVKRITLAVCILNMILTVLQPIWSMIYLYVVLEILKIRVTASMTAGMVLNLSRLSWLAGFGLLLFITGFPIKMVAGSPQLSHYIDIFRFDYIFDIRNNKAMKYDVRILKDARGYGHVMPLYEEDLLTHLLLLGPSGTGKTSSSITPMIICLLEQKCRNREKRESELLKLVKEGKGYIIGPVAHPTEYDIEVFPEHRDERKEIYKKYPDCGITCVSPNESIGNDVVSLCNACNVSVNMIDPTKKYTEKNVRLMGMNPFYVPFGLPEEERAVLIVNQAQIFSDTLITVNESSADGGGEQYFRDLNTSVTNNIAIICMLHANLSGRQTSLEEIQECINDFKMLYPKIQKINDMLRMGINISNPYKLEEEKKNRTWNKRGGADEYHTEGLAAMLNANDIYNRKDDTSTFPEYNLISDGTTEKEDIRVYRFAVEYVNDELFCHGDRMYDQSRGLRNLLNDMVAHPKVFRLLNGRENFLDYDCILARCEITVLDSGIRIGQQASTALGLFFLLNHKRAVLRRKEEDRQLHFLIIDEATQYVHPWIEDAISLYRQYRCACTFSFQSLAQLDKTNKTRYIKGLLLTVGNIIIYGRVGVEEMKTFEAMGGYKKILEVQRSSNRTSVLSESPTESIGERILEKEAAITSASELRIRAFQEVTWIGTQKGDVQFAKMAKLSFADRRRLNHGFHAIDWSQCVQEAGESRESQSEEQDVDQKEQMHHYLYEGNYSEIIECAGSADPVAINLEGIQDSLNQPQESKTGNGEGEHLFPECGLKKKRTGFFSLEQEIHVPERGAEVQKEEEDITDELFL